MWSQFDWYLLALAFLIPICGLVVLYSAGYDPDASDFLLKWLPGEIKSIPFEKQLFFLGVGVLVVAAALSIPTAWLQRLAYPVYGLCFILLIAVLIPKIGIVSNGSRRWIPLGIFNLQPAEFMKTALILTLARYLSRNLPRPGGYGFRQMLVPSLLFALPMYLVARQPDLGSALSLGAIGFSMLLFVGIRVRALVIMALTLVLAAYPAWHHLHPYQQRRVLVLFDPDADPKGSGYHITQSKIAVGSGQILGKGFLNGTQTQLEFLPEHTTDFIFSVLAEEWGFIGCVSVIFLYALFLVRILRVVARSKDVFTALVAFGVCAWFFFHTFINIGMVVGLLPVVGIPLPLFSYGGSALLSCLFGVGLVLGVAMRRLSYARG
ncbi:MAG: rod shape-determining protein RodA [Oligoflexia bacterium]|nr:rod shape-determining protein RodA [Oligoflexia bacterium]